MDDFNIVYDFSIKPENYQPSGYADFSKIYDLTEQTTFTYKYLDTEGKQVVKVLNTIKKEITDENGFKKFIYIWPNVRFH